MKKIRHYDRLTACIVLSVFGFLGIIFLVSSQASTPYISREPEDGTISGVTEVNNSNASGGKAIKFGSGSGGDTMNIYRGATHAHTGTYNTHGQDDSNPRDLFVRAKASPLWDFFFYTEHSGITGPSSVPGVVPQRFYDDAVTTAAELTDSSFVGFTGYEYSDNGGDGDDDGGHMTGLGTDNFVSADAPGMDFGNFLNYLVAQSTTAGHTVIAGFNHPGRAGHPASERSFLTPARRNVVVMSEVMNTTEGRGGDPKHYDGLIIELDRGWRVAPTCGLDSHGTFHIPNTEKATDGPCRLGLLAPSLTRANILSALQNRRTFATRDLNMNISYKVNGQWMGSQIGTPSTLNFDIDVSDPDTGDPGDKIKKIEIITEGGNVVQTRAFNDHSVNWKVSLPANNKKYYFVRVFNNERDTHRAVAAPVWLE